MGHGSFFISSPLDGASEQPTQQQGGSTGGATQFLDHFEIYPFHSNLGFLPFHFIDMALYFLLLFSPLFEFIFVAPNPNW